MRGVVGSGLVSSWLSEDGDGDPVPPPSRGVAGADGVPDSDLGRASTPRIRSATPARQACEVGPPRARVATGTWSVRRLVHGMRGRGGGGTASIPSGRHTGCAGAWTSRGWLSQHRPRGSSPRISILRSTGPPLGARRLSGGSVSVLGDQLPAIPVCP